MKALYIVDMQKDFINPDGSLYIKDGAATISNIQKLIAHTKEKRWPRLGSMDRHFMDDFELEHFPPHCMNKAVGQQLVDELDIKLIFAIPDKVGIHGKFARFDYPTLVDIIKQVYEYDMLVFEKQFTDVWTNPHIGFVVEKMGIDEVIVVGVASDFCVKDAVRGFLMRGVKVYLVVDAIAGTTPMRHQHAIEKMAEDGTTLIDTKDVLEME